MDDDLSVRRAEPADLSAVDRLLARSYPRLLAPDYPPSVMVTAVPIIARARPELLASGRYYLVLDCSGDVVGAGGYSLAAPGGRGGHRGAPSPPLGHIRHVATDPDHVRRGVGRALMARIVKDAAREGVTRLECLSTLTAVPYYASFGFAQLGAVEIPLAAGIVFPAIRMLREGQ